MKKPVAALVALLILSSSPLSGQCEQTLAGEPFSFPDTPIHTTSFSSTSPFSVFSSSCGLTSCEYDLARFPGSPFNFLHLYTPFLGAVTDLPYFAVNRERVVYRFSFSPTAPGTHTSSVTTLLRSELGTGCTERMLSGSTTSGLCIYVNDDQALGLGHTWMQLLPDSGSFAGAEFLAYGLYSKNFIIGDGEINNETFNQWDARVCFPLTDEKYKQAQKKISASFGNTSYSFAGSVTGDEDPNCQSWALDIAESAGIDILDDVLGFLGRNLPHRLLEKLRDTGHGNIFGQGGFVEVNDSPDQPDTPNLSLDQVGRKVETQGDLEDYGTEVDGVRQAALSVSTRWPVPGEKASRPISLTAEVMVPALKEPARLAALLGIPLTEVVLPDIHTRPHRDILVEASNHSDNVSVHWGEFPIEDLDFENAELPTPFTNGLCSHTYSSNGTYPVTMAVLHNGRLYIYRWSFLLGQASGQPETKDSTLIRIDVPGDPPFISPNGPFTPPINPVSPDDVFLDGFESGDMSRWSSSVGI